MIPGISTSRPVSSSGEYSFWDDTYWVSTNPGNLVWNSGRPSWDASPSEFWRILQPVSSGPNVGWQVDFRPATVEIFFNTGTVASPYVETFDGDLVDNGILEMTESDILVSKTFNLNLTADIVEFRLGSEFSDVGNWYIYNMIFRD